MRHARGHKLQRIRLELPFYLFLILCPNTSATPYYQCHTLPYVIWTSYYSFLENKCFDPGNIWLPNGNVTISDRLFEEFTTISFECDKDYELLGEEDSVCLQGKWSAKLPFCRSKCVLFILSISSLMVCI